MKRVLPWILLAGVGFAVPSMIYVFTPLWVCPQKNNCSESFVPIAYRYKISNDDYFYYSRIRKVLDGHPFAGDSVTLENRYRYTPHVTYQLSFILGSIGGWFTGKTAEAFFFNNSILPVAISVLSILFVFEFLESWSLAIFLVGIAILHLGPLRFPNIQFTSIPLMALFLIAIQTYKKNSQPVFKRVLAIAILGSAILVSLPNFMICFTIWTCLCVLLLKNRQLCRQTVWILVLGAIFALPGLILFRQSQEFVQEWIAFAIEPVAQYKGFNPALFWSTLKSVYFPWWTAALIVLSYPLKSFLLGLHLAFFVLYLVLTGIDGSFFARYVAFRGADVFFALEPWLLLILLLRQWLPTIVWKYPWLNRVALTASVAGSLLMIAFYSHKQFDQSRLLAPFYHDREFKQLYEWSLNETKDDQVAVSLDFDLDINLPVHSKLNMYLPWAHSSPVHTAERESRLFEILSFYGLTPDDFASLLHGMISHMESDRSPDRDFQQRSLMQLVLFYGKYSFTPISDFDVSNFKKRYEIYLASSARTFQFQADYLILSPQDGALVRPGSVAETILRQRRAVFENQRYRVFALH